LLVDELARLLSWNKVSKYYTPPGENRNLTAYRNGY